MIDFITAILNGNIPEILGDLYTETVQQIVIWWAVIPLAGVVLLFVLTIVQIFGGRYRG